MTFDRLVERARAAQPVARKLRIARVDPGTVLAHAWPLLRPGRPFPDERISPEHGGTALLGPDGDAWVVADLPEQSWKGARGYRFALLVGEVVVAGEAWEDAPAEHLDLGGPDAAAVDEAAGAVRRAARGLGGEATEE